LCSFFVDRYFNFVSQLAEEPLVSICGSYIFKLVQGSSIPDFGSGWLSWLLAEKAENGAVSHPLSSALHELNIESRTVKLSSLAKLTWITPLALTGSKLEHLTSRSFSWET